MHRPLRAAAAALGSRGGRAGSGAAKRRGDSEYYRTLAARRRDRSRGGTGMTHRHLDRPGTTLAAIDDVIANGGWESWLRLRQALRTDPAIREKILKVCAAHENDHAAQRHRFWKQYAQDAGKAP
jgi:hypothetical protein